MSEQKPKERKLKDNSRKHPQARMAWKERQKAANAAKGKQVFDKVTKEWNRIHPDLHAGAAGGTDSVRPG